MNYNNETYNRKLCCLSNKRTNKNLNQVRLDRIQLPLILIYSFDVFEFIL